MQHFKLLAPELYLELISLLFLLHHYVFEKIAYFFFFHQQVLQFLVIVLSFLCVLLVETA